MLCNEESVLVACQLNVQCGYEQHSVWLHRCRLSRFSLVERQESHNRKVLKEQRQINWEKRIALCCLIAPRIDVSDVAAPRSSTLEAVQNAL